MVTGDTGRRRRQSQSASEAAAQDAFNGTMLRRGGPLRDWGLEMLRIAGLNQTNDPDELEQHSHALAGRLQESVGEPNTLTEKMLEGTTPQRLMAGCTKRHTLYVRITVNDELCELLVPLSSQVVFDLRHIQRVARTGVLEGTKAKLSTLTVGWATTEDRGYTTSAARGDADPSDYTQVWGRYGAGISRPWAHAEFNVVDSKAIIEWADTSPGALARAALASWSEKRHYNVHFEYQAGTDTHVIHAARAHGNPHHAVLRSQRGAASWPVEWVGLRQQQEWADAHRAEMLAALSSVSGTARAQRDDEARRFFMEGE